MIFCDGLMNPEGPVLLPNGDWLIVEMAPERGCVSRISSDGMKRIQVAKTGRPNGLAIDSKGNIWVAESKNPPSLLKMSLDGKFDVYLSGLNSDPFLWPNDLAFGPDGVLYMTDSGILEPIWREYRDGHRKKIKLDGKVWRINISTKTAEKIDLGIQFANGIAFDSNKWLYVNEMLTGEIFRYDLSKSDPKREFFANAFSKKEKNFQGVDGMAFDDQGRLFVTVIGPGDIAIFGTSGNLERRLPLLGKQPTNVAFGKPGEKRIYVTEQEMGQIEAFDVNVDGMQLYA